MKLSQKVAIGTPTPSFLATSANGCPKGGLSVRNARGALDRLYDRARFMNDA